MADKWRRLRPKHPYVTAGLAVGIIVGVVVLVSLLRGRGAEPASDSVPCSAEPAELSFITSFGLRNVHACYGSLVAPQYVVTTAYCITTNTAFLNLTMGRSDLDGEGGVTRSISDYRVHPKWDPNDPKTWAYDQAVVKLDRPVENIKPACLAAEGSVFPTGTNATVYCWCKVGTSDLPAPRTLQAVNMTVYDHGQCKRKYYGNMTDDMICAGNDAGGQNICQGDSGAPLVVKVGDDLIVLGSNIRGPPECAAPNSPAVYLIHGSTSFATDAIKQMSDPPQVTQCGMRNNVPDVRVENGQVSAPHSLPWMGYIEGDDGYFYGGAALIHESFVVAVSARPGRFVVLGAHNRSSTSEPIQKIMIEKVFRHPNFTGPNWRYLGMLLVKLSRPVKFTKNIGPICLPKPGYALPAGSECLVSGWGDDKPPDYPPLTDLLREGSVTTITTDQCRRDWADHPSMDKYIFNTTICTARDKTHPSWYDEGGPLSCEEKDSLIYYLHGVLYDGWSRRPSLYHDVSAMLPWINEVISQFPADAASKVCFKKFEG